MFSKEEAKELRLLFWHKLESKTRRLPGQKGKAFKWIGDRTGVKGLDLRFDVDRSKAVVAIEVNSRDENRRIELFQKLEACKSIIESEFGEPLIWNFFHEKENGDMVARVYTETEADIYDQEQWPDMIYFLINRMLKLEKAFLEVQDFLKYRELGQ